MSKTTLTTWTAPRIVRLGQITDVANNANPGSAQNNGGGACNKTCVS